MLFHDQRRCQARLCTPGRRTPWRTFSPPRRRQGRLGRGKAWACTCTSVSTAAVAAAIAAAGTGGGGRAHRGVNGCDGNVDALAGRGFALASATRPCGRGRRCGGHDFHLNLRAAPSHSFSYTGCGCLTLCQTTMAIVTSAAGVTGSFSYSRRRPLTVLTRQKWQPGAKSGVVVSSREKRPSLSETLGQTYNHDTLGKKKATRPSEHRRCKIHMPRAELDGCWPGGELVELLLEERFRPRRKTERQEALAAPEVLGRHGRQPIEPHHR